jgi:serine protease Do
MIQDVDGSLAQALGVTDGVLAADVLAESPGARMGLQAGDVIVSLDGQDVTSRAAFRAAVAARGPDTRVELVVDRRGSRLTLTGKLGSLPDEEAPGAPGTSEPDGGRLGVAVRPLDERARAELEVPSDVGQGAVVDQVEPDSPAARLGLRPGDVLLEVNRTPVHDAASLRRALGQPGPALLVVLREGRRLWLGWER